MNANESYTKSDDDMKYLRTLLYRRTDKPLFDEALSIKMRLLAYGYLGRNIMKRDMDNNEFIFLLKKALHVSLSSKHI